MGIHYTESEEEGIRFLGLYCEVYNDEAEVVIRRMHVTGEDMTAEEKRELHPLLQAIFTARRQVEQRGYVPGLVSIYERSVQVWPVKRFTPDGRLLENVPSRWVAFR